MLRTWRLADSIKMERPECRRRQRTLEKLLLLARMLRRLEQTAEDINFILRKNYNSNSIGQLPTVDCAVPRP